MSDSTAPTDPNTLLFPLFLYGENAVCRRRYRAEVKKWAKRYEERGDFPEPKLIPVPPGSIMWTHDGAAEMLMLGSHERRKTPNWHFHLLRFMETEVSPGSPPRELFYAAYEAFTSRYPWGALSLTIHYPPYITFARVWRGLEAVLSFWEQLDTLRYIDLHLEEIDLAKLLYYHNHGFIHTYADAPIGRPVRDVLRQAMERMRDASENEIHAFQMRRLYQLVDVDPDLKHRQWLKTPGLIETELAHTKETEPEWYNELITGRTGVHSSFLKILERKHPTP